MGLYHIRGYIRDCIFPDSQLTTSNKVFAKRRVENAACAGTPHRRGWLENMLNCAIYSDLALNGGLYIGNNTEMALNWELNSSKLHRLKFCDLLGG